MGGVGGVNFGSGVCWGIGRRRKSGGFTALSSPISPYTLYPTWEPIPRLVKGFLGGLIFDSILISPSLLTHGIPLGVCEL